MPLKGRDIIASVGLKSDFFGEDLSPDRLAAFQALMQHLDAEKVLWLCPLFQVQCKDPRSAQTLGIARTVRTELSLPLFTMEIGINESRFEELVHGVLQKIRTTKDTHPSSNLPTTHLSSNLPTTHLFSDLPTTHASSNLSTTHPTTHPSSNLPTRPPPPPHPPRGRGVHRRRSGQEDP
jgi:hypothetical protein